MRVLIITMLDVWSMGPGVGAQSLAETVRGYVRKGHDVTVLSPSSPDPRAFPRANFVATGAIPRGLQGARRRLRGRKSVGASPDANAGAHPGRRRRFYIPGGQSSLLEMLKVKLQWIAFQIRVMRYLISTGRSLPDVVYAYEVHAFPAAKLYASIIRRPLVSRFQGTIVAPTQNPIERLLCAEHRYALRAGSRLTIMTDDGTLGDRVLVAAGVPADRVMFLRNGLAPELLLAPRAGARGRARNQLDIPDKTPLIMTASRLVHWKRVDRAISMINTLRRTHSNACLAILGDGPERQVLEEQARACGVQDNVLFVGGVPHAQVRSWLEASDVFVSFFELSNVGNPLLEAMCAGVPVVTLANGGTPAVVQHGLTGLLLDCWDERLAAQFVAELLDEEDYARRLAQCARHWAERNLMTWDQRLDMEVRAVEEIVEVP